MIFFPTNLCIMLHFRFHSPCFILLFPYCCSYIDHPHCILNAHYIGIPPHFVSHMHTHLW